MATVLEIFRNIAPEFAQEEDSRVTFFIDLVKPQVNPDVFDEDYNSALAYLAADAMVMSKREGGVSGGAVISQSAGQLSQTFSSPYDNKYNSSYGQMYVRLREMHSIGMTIIK